MLRWLVLAILFLPLSAQDLRLQVLHTSDTHGHILPEDTFSLQPANKGWAKLATLIRAQKALNPNTLLLDTGDTIQGEPINYVHQAIRPDLLEPMTAIMRSLGCLAMTPGNHDFEWGLDTLRKAEKQAGFPFLAANVLDASARPAFPTHLVVERGGARIAVLGLVSSRVARQGIPGGLQGLRFTDAVEAARTWVPRLRSQEKADVVILAIHGGLGRIPCQPGDENVALCIAETVPGIDLILTGHTHMAVSTRHKGIPILQPSAHGKVLGVADLSLHRDRGRWILDTCATRLVNVEKDTPQDSETLYITSAQRAATELYLNTFATNLQVDLDGRWTRMEDTAMMQLIHTVQRQASGAQISAAFSPGTRIFVPRGTTSIRQFWSFMVYENRLARIRVTGAQLRAYLEHAARFYAFSHQPDLFNREIHGFDYDILDGVSYALDISKPLGSRVVGLRFQGQPVTDQQTFTMAINTYRLGNGGGYLEAMKWTGEPEWVSEASLRNLLLAHVLSRPTLDVELKNHWRIIPSLDRERILAQQP